ncbi:MAG: ABC transporter ATP-binding protein, partial [Lachnospiraceae bacterium]|nr:ABC transporter ATP-binding protein [Lachnospiraceae bacterium]
MLKKISYVLDRRQKIQLVLLLFTILIGAIVELMGITLILPIVSIAMDPSVIDETWYLIIIRDTFGLYEVKEMLLFLASLLIGVYIFKNIYITYMYNAQYHFTYDNQRVLAIKLMDCYMHQKYQFHVSKNVAELQRNITNDVNGFYTVVLNVLQFLTEISVCAFLVVSLMMEDVMATSMVAILVVIFVLFFARFFKKVLGKKGEQSRDLNALVNKWILQSFSGIKEIKVINAEQFFIDNYDKHYKESVSIKRQQSILTFIPRPIMETVCISGLLITLIIRLVMGDGDITAFIPTLSVFVMAAFRMLPAFNRITGYLGTIMFNLPSIHAVYDDLMEIEQLMKDKEQDKHDIAEITLNDAIRMEKLSFKYPENDKWILENVDLEIPKNTSVAFIGSSGAGKTTAADVILGLLEPQSGKVTIDGMDIKEHMHAWHSCIGYIPQTIYLMDDTIRANITFGVSEEEVDEERVRKALKEAQLDVFVDSLKEGLDTVIGDRGVKLSGGQRQRIGIARALYRNPKVLILDEATSALDNETEKEVMAAIDELHGTRTLIVIAHRLSTIKKCDRIYEVGNGKVVGR